MCGGAPGSTIGAGITEQRGEHLLAAAAGTQRQQSVEVAAQEPFGQDEQPGGMPQTAAEFPAE